LTAKEIAHMGARLALSKKAGDVCILDLQNITDMTDYFVICSGDSDTQVKAITDALIDGLRDRGQRMYKKEGYTQLHWVLVDYVDVVFHIFQPRIREYYNLERLWGDAEMERIADDTL